jgi:hypothetical protein
MHLRHQHFGGVTHFQSLVGTNIPEFVPKLTALQRSIQHILDYGVKPQRAQAPTGEPTTHAILSLNDRLHQGELVTPVLYHSHYLATGWGKHLLTVDKLGIAFGLPAWVRHKELDRLQTFPLVPIQVMDGCLKGILASILQPSPLQTPDPSLAAPLTNRSWLPPSIQCFLPHLWIDFCLVTDKAVKQEDAGVATQLWDKQCSLVLPATMPALDMLHRMFLCVACHRMVAEF